MTVYQLIQKLAQYDGDTEVVVEQDGARKRRVLYAVNQPTSYSRTNREVVDWPVILRLRIEREE